MNGFLKALVAPASAVVWGATWHIHAIWLAGIGLGFLIIAAGGLNAAPHVGVLKAFALFILGSMVFLGLAVGLDYSVS
jgi:hypothetical protein